MFKGIVQGTGIIKKYQKMMRPKGTVLSFQKTSWI